MGYSIQSNSLHLAATYRNRGQFMPKDARSMMDEIVRKARDKAIEASTKYKSPGPAGLKRMGHPFSRRGVTSRLMAKAKARGKSQRARLGILKKAKAIQPYPPEYIGHGFDSNGSRFSDSFRIRTDMIKGNREVQSLVYNTKRASDGNHLLGYFKRGTRLMIPRPIDKLVEKKMAWHIPRIQGRWARRTMNRQIGGAQIQFK